MKTKNILVAASLIWLTAAGLSYSYANNEVNAQPARAGIVRPELTEEQKEEMKAKMEEVKTIIEKKKNGEELTSEEETKLEEAAKIRNKSMRWPRAGEWIMMNDLTDEEKEEVKNMTDEEKKEFFEKKREEREAEMKEKREEMEAREGVIDKLLAGEKLTDDEEEIRTEIIEARAEAKEKREEMEAKMEEVKTVLEKKEAGEELTEEDEAILKEAAQQRKGWRQPGMRR